MIASDHQRASAHPTMNSYYSTLAKQPLIKLLILSRNFKLYFSASHNNLLVRTINKNYTRKIFPMLCSIVISSSPRGYYAAGELDTPDPRRRTTVTGTPVAAAAVRESVVVSTPAENAHAAHHDHERLEELQQLQNEPLETCSTGVYRGSRLSKAEAAIAHALQSVFPGESFEKVRPVWLTNARTKRRLEIDLFCETLGLGLERQGIQHYLYPNGIHTSRAAFEALQERDKLKVELCKKHGITLIHVPFTVPAKDTESFLREELRRLNFGTPAVRPQQCHHTMQAEAHVCST